MLDHKITCHLPHRFKTQYSINTRLSYKSSSTMYSIFDNTTSAERILKIVPKRSFSFDIHHILSQISDTSLLLPLETFCSGKYVYMIFEKKCSLREYISSTGISLQDILQMGIDIAHALSLLHEHEIMHLDISPSNIYIEDSHHFLLGDFSSCSSSSSQSSKFKQRLYVTREYSAPELLSKGLPSSLCDQYSLGILLVSLCTFLNSKKDSPMQLPTYILPILEKACAQDPNQRYPSILSFKEELLSLYTSERNISSHRVSIENPLHPLFFHSTQPLPQKSLSPAPSYTMRIIQALWRPPIISALGFILLLSLYIILYLPKSSHVSKSPSVFSSTYFPTMSPSPHPTCSLPPTPSVSPSPSPKPVSLLTQKKWTIRNTHTHSIKHKALIDKIQTKQTTLLDAGNNQISSLSDLSTFVSLRELYINNNQITSLTTLSQLKKLRIIIASYNHIVDVSSIHLLPKLEVLDLSGNRNVKNLLELQHCKNLKTLILANITISNATKKQLAQGLPNCTIVY